MKIRLFCAAVAALVLVAPVSQKPAQAQVGAAAVGGVVAAGTFFLLSRMFPPAHASTCWQRRDCSPPRSNPHGYWAYGPSPAQTVWVVTAPPSPSYYPPPSPSHAIVRNTTVRSTTRTSRIESGRSTYHPGQRTYKRCRINHDDGRVEYRYDIPEEQCR